jgi:hypothetical protein
LPAYSRLYGNKIRLEYYIISIANTKKVVTKGRRRVNQGQCVAMAKTRATTEIKNKIQYNPFELLFTSMILILRKNRVEIQIIALINGRFY